MKHRIMITRTHKDLGYAGAFRLIRRAAQAALDAEGVTERCTIDVTLTNDEHIHKINKEFRKVDSATDVLSFPMCELKPGAFDADDCGWDPDTETIPLGDMVISLERCAAQGEEYGHGFEHEVMYLTVHSVLHLLGYDHVDEAEMKKQMRAREKVILAALEGADACEE